MDGWIKGMTQMIHLTLIKHSLRRKIQFYIKEWSDIGVKIKKRSKYRFHGVLQRMSGFNIKMAEMLTLKRLSVARTGPSGQDSVCQDLIFTRDICILKYFGTKYINDEE